VKEHEGTIGKLRRGARFGARGRSVTAVGRRTRKGHTLALRLRNGLHALFLATSVARLDDDSSTGLVLRRDRWLGLLLVRESTWLAAASTGRKPARFPRGDVFRRRELAEGMLHGSVRAWHANGVKALECRYERGLLHGKTSAWRRDGTKRFVGEYRSGAKTASGSTSRATARSIASARACTWMACGCRGSRASTSGWARREGERGRAEPVSRR